MILYEFEGKKLLSLAGIQVPKSQLLNSLEDQLTISAPCVLKAQVLSGKRADAGGIVVVRSQSELIDQLEEMFGKVVNNETVEKILVEELVEVDKEYYVSISYDTETRGPLLALSESGGTGIEEREVTSIELDPLNLDQQLDQSKLFGLSQQLITSIIKLFYDQDAVLLEINPLVKTKSGEWMALDAKVKLDDTALKRHEDWVFSPRGVPGYTPTANEIAAKRIDEEDYRGTAGSAYFDIDGDIAVLSSGGGVSLTAMDALISFGGKPANFTEYSGNPPKEKVAKLTEVVLDKPNIHGLWVIGTVAANFTDIYETLSGLIEGLKMAQTNLGKRFDFPIVIRRGGPREIEAYEMLKGISEFDLNLQKEETSIVESAKVMADLAADYAKRSQSQ